ncbi:hypothetical protein MRX96_035280 [Rhipicephalus microplus]
MREESRRQQESLKRCNRKIALMLKLTCQQGNRNHSIEAQKRTKRTVLNQCHEEMANMSPQALTARLTIFKANSRRCSWPDVRKPNSRRTRASTKFRPASSNKKWRA